MQCDLCGCRGIHACIGSKQKPWTEDDHVKFKEAMKIVKQLRSKRRMKDVNPGMGKITDVIRPEENSWVDSETQGFISTETIISNGFIGL